jgi:hypothetical protein
VNLVHLAPAISAAVAVVAAICSLVGWVRARREREAAAEQAKIATEARAAASQALQQIAAVQLQQNEQQQVRASAAERDPWVFWPESKTGAAAEIFNDSGTAKYHVRIKVYANDQPWDEKLIPFVGPKRSARLPDNADLAAEMRAVITWHLDEGVAGSPCEQTIEW